MVDTTQKKQQTESPTRASSSQYYEGVGRRKESSARARLYVVKNASATILGVEVVKGGMVVNGKPVEEYFGGEVSKKLYLEPFRTTNTIGRFAVSITVVGGGQSGQLGATIHAISRALAKVDPDKFHSILRKRDFLTRDPRAKERRKAGRAGKARAKKQSPKR